MWKSLKMKWNMFFVSSICNLHCVIAIATEYWNRYDALQLSRALWLIQHALLTFICLWKLCPSDAGLYRCMFTLLYESEHFLRELDFPELHIPAIFDHYSVIVLMHRSFMQLRTFVYWPVTMKSTDPLRNIWTAACNLDWKHLLLQLHLGLWIPHQGVFRV